MFRLRAFSSIALLFFVMMTMAFPFKTASSAQDNVQPFPEIKDNSKARPNVLDKGIVGTIEVILERLDELEAYKIQADEKIAYLEAQLASEVSERIAADVLLDNNLAQEQSSRIEADTDILNQLESAVLPEKLLNLVDYVEVASEDINGLSGPHVIIEGANLHIRSGSGATNDDGSATGLGNLIVGYNEPREAFTKEYLWSFGGKCTLVHDPYDFDSDSPTGVDPCDEPLTSRRAGSHNLIVGEYHNYNSYGGIIGGMLNAIDEYAVSASVLGGVANLATHPVSTVVGGASNVVSANQSSIVGGQSNRVYSYFNFDIGDARPPYPVDPYGSLSKSITIVGGRGNIASGPQENVIVGGLNNSAVVANNSVIVGGQGNYINSDSCEGSCDDSVILGGIRSTLTDDHQVQPLTSTMEAFVASQGGGSCSDETKQYFDIMSDLPFAGGLFSWLSNGCDIW